MPAMTAFSSSVARGDRPPARHPWHIRQPHPSALHETGMWRRIVNTARSFIRNSPSPPTAPYIGPGSINTPGPWPASSPLSDEIKKKAYFELNSAIRELSEGRQAPMSAPVHSVLKDWVSQNPSTLSKEQCEQLAKVYYEGADGVPRDPKKAVELWTLAAAQGSVEAMYSRAACQKEGLGIEKDEKGAFEEFKKIAAEHDLCYAYYSMALMLEKGEGCDQNDTEAFKNFAKAARGGVLPAIHNLANAFASGRGVNKNEDKARQLYQFAAEAGDPAACFVLGCWHYQGHGGLTRDPAKAFALHLQAAEASHPNAMFNVGAALLGGDGVPADPAKAAEWFERAGELRMEPALINLAKMLMEGNGVAQDLNKAKEVLQRVDPTHEVAVELLEEVDRLLALKK